MWKVLLLITIFFSLSNTTSLKRQKRELPPGAENKNDSSNSSNEMSMNETKGNTTNLNLPSNATSIRENISDTFSCEGKSYGYYADTDNDCQVFHVCLPVDYGNSRAGRKMRVYKYSFICPETTMFDQEALTCNFEERMRIECAESPQYYEMSNPEDNNDNYQDGKSTKMMETSTKPSFQQDKTTSKNLFEYSALEGSGISQKLLQKLPAYLFRQDLQRPQLNEELMSAVNSEETDDINENDDSVMLPLMQLQQVQVQPQFLETQREQRTAKIGRRGFLFKADADAAFLTDVADLASKAAYATNGHSEKEYKT